MRLAQHMMGSLAVGQKTARPFVDPGSKGLTELCRRAGMLYMLVIIQREHRSRVSYEKEED